MPTTKLVDLHVLPEGQLKQSAGSNLRVSKQEVRSKPREF